MRDEERRYDEASQLCRAADDLRARIESLRGRLRERRFGSSPGPDPELERAEEAAGEALEELKRYRDKLVESSPTGVGAG